MAISHEAGTSPALLDELRRAVVGLGTGESKVLDVRLALIEDLTDALAWRVTLVLPRPGGDTWDLEETLALEDEVRAATDTAAQRLDLEVDGLTSVVLTTEQASVDDVAIDGEPEPGERPDDTGDGRESE